MGSSSASYKKVLTTNTTLTTSGGQSTGSGQETTTKTVDKTTSASLVDKLRQALRDSKDKVKTLINWIGRVLDVLYTRIKTLINSLNATKSELFVLKWMLLTTWQQQLLQ